MRSRSGRLDEITQEMQVVVDKHRWGDAQK